jgi:hypothetical protein
MTSRVKKKLCLSQDGQRVKVVGPFIEWDEYEQSAVFSVTITQTDAAGAKVTAVGSSSPAHAPYHPPANRWDAIAVVTEPAKRLHNGPADADAVATITVGGPNSKRYPWHVDVKLVSCHDFE